MASEKTHGCAFREHGLKGNAQPVCARGTQRDGGNFRAVGERGPGFAGYQIASVGFGNGPGETDLQRYAGFAFVQADCGRGLVNRRQSDLQRHGNLSVVQPRWRGQCLRFGLDWRNLASDFPRSDALGQNNGREANQHPGRRDARFGCCAMHPQPLERIDHQGSFAVCLFLAGRQKLTRLGLAFRVDSGDRRYARDVANHCRQALVD